LRVLLAEDNEMNRSMLARRLKRAGFEVLLAADGEQALNIAHAEQPDVILMDVSMPGVSGLDATRELKSDPKTARIPVVVLTAHSSADDRQMAADAGCDGYEVKPIDFRRLVATLQELGPA
jgi:two-component system cell cycle response regulator DivK